MELTLTRNCSAIQMSRAFHRYIGIDYSGAETPTSSLKGLRLYEAEADSTPCEVQPPASPRKYWTRRGIAEWLVSHLANGPATLVGIDHGFSFPLRYFEQHQLPLDWPLFLDDFQRHWPTDEDHTYVEFVRDGSCGNCAARSGNSRWRRLTELRARTAKSVFQFDVQGSVPRRSPTVPHMPEIDVASYLPSTSALSNYEGVLLGPRDWLCRQPSSEMPYSPISHLLVAGSMRDRLISLPCFRQKSSNDLSVTKVSRSLSCPSAISF